MTRIAAATCAVLLTAAPAAAQEPAASPAPDPNAPAATATAPVVAPAPSAAAPSAAAPSATAPSATAPSATAPPATAPPATAPPATAQAADEAERKKLEEEIARELGVQPGQAAPAAAPSPQAAPPAPAATGGNPYARVLLLPDVSAIGRAAVVYDSLDVARLSPRSGAFGPAGEPAALLQEVELGLQAVVDPYARADLFLSFGPEGADVEEAYVTTLALPAGFQVRAGKLFSPFGRLNQQHPHVWEFADAPLARDRVLVDGGEVLSGPGLDVAWLAPVPWFAELRVAGQDTVVEGQADPALTGIARLLQYFQLGDATTLGLGLSAGTRDEGRGAFRDLGGVDVFVKHRPPQGRAYASFQGELYARRFRGREGGSDLGGYAQVFFRRSAYVGYGVRFDAAPAQAEAVAGSEQRFSAVGAWFLSEFQRIRAQLSYDRLPDGRDGVEALLQLEFGIGAHGAHPF